MKNLDHLQSDIVSQKFKIDRNLLTLCSVSFLVPFMGSAINLAMPYIGRHFYMSAITLTWVATAYLVTTAILQIPFAKVADIFGRKKMFLNGIMIFTVSSILCGLSPNTSFFLLMRVIEGIGSAIMFGTSTAILIALYPVKFRAIVIAINTAAIYASLAIGPFFGGILTDILGWQSLFFVTGGIGFLCYILCRIGIKKEWIESKNAKFDYIGTIIYAITLFCIIYGVSNLEYIHGITNLIIGIITLIIFITYERKQTYPVINLKLFSNNKVFALSSLAALLNYASTSGVMFMLSLYLQYIRKMSAKEAGVLLILGAIVQSIIALLSGKLSEKIHPTKLATSGMSIIVSALLLYAFILNETTPLTIIVIIHCLIGVGFGIFASPNTNVIMSSVNEKDYTQASAITGTARLIGQTFSLGIAGMTMSFYIGNNIITDQYHSLLMQSIKVTLSILAGLCIIGIYCSLIRIKK